MTERKYTVLCKSCGFTEEIVQESDLITYIARVDDYGLCFDAECLHEQPVRTHIFEHHNITRPLEESRRGHIPYEVTSDRGEVIKFKVNDYRVQQDLPFEQAYEQVKIEALKRGIRI